MSTWINVPGHTRVLLSIFVIQHERFLPEKSLLFLLIFDDE